MPVDWVSVMDRAARFAARRWRWTPEQRERATEAAQLRLCESMAKGLVLLPDENKVFALCVSYLLSSRRHDALGRSRARHWLPRLEGALMAEPPARSPEPSPDAERMARVLDAVNHGVRTNDTCARVSRRPPRRLNAREKICWLMHDILGMEPQEVADALGVTRGTVRTSTWEVRTVVKRELANG